MAARGGRGDWLFLHNAVLLLVQVCIEPLDSVKHSNLPGNKNI